MIKAMLFSVVEWGVSLVLFSLPLVVLVLLVLKIVQQP